MVELMAIGSAMAHTCEPGFTHHFDRARQLGVFAEDLRKAVHASLSVGFATHWKGLEIEERCLNQSFRERGCSLQLRSGQPMIQEVGRPSARAFR